MKKTLCALILVFMILSALTSCSISSVPRPEIKEGRFNISVTYEYNGEIKTVSGVYVCEYDGVVWWNINGDPFVKWKESFEGDIKDDDTIFVCNTNDGGEIFINLFTYPEYFMGDPEASRHTPRIYAELWYPDEQINDVERIAEYGVRIIDYEYDDPIENTFK